MSKIVRFEAENVKRLKVVEIVPGPDGLVIIRGDNEQGKTSVLDAIAMALGGKGVQPPKPMRDGTVDAHVLLELDDLVVERRWTSNDKSQVEVRSKEGAKFPSPQAMLDKLVGRLSFDPLAFLDLEPKAQAAAVRQLVALDFTALDLKRQAIYDKRTEANRLLADLEGQLAGLKDVMPVETVDVAAQVAELTRLGEVAKAQGRQQMDRDQAEFKVTTAGNDQARALEAVTALERQVAEAKAKLETVRAGLFTARKELAEFEEIVAAQLPVTEAIATVRGNLQRAEVVNTQARKHGEQLELKKRVTAGKALVTQQTAAIEAIDADKAVQLGKAKFPVPGLGFGEVGLTLDGIPFEQSSGAQQLKVTVAMGLALNPELKVLLVRDGTKLDSKNLALVGDMAKVAGAQVWLEVVGKQGVGVVIEDGSVESVTSDEKLTSPPAKKPRGKKVEVAS